MVSGDERHRATRDEQSSRRSRHSEDPQEVLRRIGVPAHWAARKLEATETLEPTTVTDAPTSLTAPPTVSAAPTPCVEIVDGSSDSAVTIDEDDCKVWKVMTNLTNLTACFQRL